MGDCRTRKAGLPCDFVDVEPFCPSVLICPAQRLNNPQTHFISKGDEEGHTAVKLRFQLFAVSHKILLWFKKLN